MGKSIWNFNKIKYEANEMGLELLNNDYLGYSQKLTFKDKIGFLYSCTVVNIKKKIFPSKFNIYNCYTIQNIRLWCKLNNKPFELLSDKYEGNDKKLKWKCLKDDCGEIFESTWSDIHNGYGCGYCAGQKVGLSNCLATKNPELIDEWHPTLNGDLTPFDVTPGSGKEVWWKCNHNSEHEWQMSVNTRTLMGCGCPYCAGKLPSKDYNLLVYNPILTSEWNYKKNNKNPEEYTPHSGQLVWWKCNDCGHEWNATISSRDKGNGCPECNKSKGEKEIDRVLIKNNWIKINQEELNKINDKDKYNERYFIPQKTFEKLLGLGGGLLSFDHYIPKLNLLIEFQGIQHKQPIDFKGLGEKYSQEQFEIQKEHDRRKRIYAQEHNIKLLEIWYWDFDNIESILEKTLSKLKG